jgi:hydrogenase-1 operon protein HyaF
MSLQNIPINIESAGEYSIGSLHALLVEIETLLEEFASDGTRGSIDLNSLPFAPGEYDQLRQFMGQGEISVHIEAVGPSEIIETRYPGVWWVTHYNVEGDIVADMLEITDIPEIIKSQAADIDAGLELLRAQLNNEVPQ